MATLTNQPIQDTYAGLIKTLNSLALDPTTAIQLTDGLGNNFPMSASQIGINYTGTQDFSASTVVGISEAGLVAGTGTDSLKSADILGTTANIASAANSIAIGDALLSDTANAISIGKNINNTGQGDGIIIGRDWNHVYGRDCVVIGNGEDHIFSVGQNDLVMIGRVARANSIGGVAIGHGTEVHGATGGYAIAIGYGAKAGVSSDTDECISIGLAATSTETGAVALGANVTAATANTVTVKKLQMLDYATINYADDAAAATGGIPLGGVYHTAGALKIRIA
jgi:hypothetical protein